MKVALSKNGEVVFTYVRGTTDIPVALALLHNSFVAETNEEHKQYIAGIQFWLIIHAAQDRSKKHES